MTISLDKTYKTRDGHEVRLFDIIPDQVHGVFGVWKYQGLWKSGNWKLDGKAHQHESSYDLIEVKPDSFDPNPFVECSKGIHFFITRKEAEEY